VAHKTEAERWLEKIKRAFAETQVARQNYLINRAMLAGRQNVWWDSRLADVRDLPKTDHMRLVANRILPATRSTAATLTRRPLVFQVLPQSADDASARASRLSESIIKARVSDRHWEHLRSDLTWALLAGGTAALANDWDPSAGRPLGMIENGRKYGTGDGVEHALTVLDFAVEPGSGHAETAKWWVRNEAMPPEEAQERLGLGETPKADSRSSAVPLTWDNTTTASADPQLVTVWTCYRRPCEEGDKGEVVTIVGNEIVNKEDWPFPFTDHLNLSVVRDIIVPGQWFGEASMSAAVSIQQAYNASLSAVVDHTRKCGNARMLIPQSVTDMLDELTDEAGQTLAYPDGAEKPEWLSPPQLPDYVIRLPDRLASELDNVLTQGDIQRGEAPGRVDSALAISVLNENQIAPLSAISDETARAFGTLASNLLACYSVKVKDRRRQKVTRKPNTPAEDVSWTGNDLQGHTRAEVPAEALAPKSRAASNALAMEMLGAGVLDPVQAARLIEWGGDEGLLQMISPHVAKAARENSRLAKGQSIIPMDLDDAAHRDTHLEFVLSEAYELLDDETKTVVMNHIRAHDQILSPEGDAPDPLAIPAPIPGDGQVAGPANPLPPAAPAQPSLPGILPPEALAPIGDEPSMSEADLAMALLQQQGVL
jgi:hypothetical protein